MDWFKSHRLPTTKRDCKKCGEEFTSKGRFNHFCCVCQRENNALSIRASSPTRQSGQPCRKPPRD